MRPSDLKGKRPAPLNLFPIPKSWFPRIEFALNVTLTEAQKYKLFYPESSLVGVRSGRAFTRCILLALSIGPPLTPDLASDYGDGTIAYKRGYFMDQYRDIATKLEAAGFDVRQVGNVGGWKIDIWGENVTDFTTNVNGEKYTITHIPVINREIGKCISGKDMLNSARIIDVMLSKNIHSLEYNNGLKMLKEKKQ